MIGGMHDTIIQHIDRKPEVCGGRPCVAGTRIRVQDVYVWHELQGQSADEIVSRFPQLTLAAVYAALTYFWDHQAELRKQMQDDEEFVESMMRKQPSPLRKKLGGGHGTDDPLPHG